MRRTLKQLFHSQSVPHTALFVQNLTEGCRLNFMSPVVKSCRLYSHDWLSLPSSRDPPPSFLRFSPLFPHRPKLPRDPLHLRLLPLILYQLLPISHVRALPDKTAQVAINSFETPHAPPLRFSPLFLQFYGFDFCISPTRHISGED